MHWASLYHLRTALNQVRQTHVREQAMMQKLTDAASPTCAPRR